MECPHCGSRWNASAQIARQLTVCPFCGGTLVQNDHPLDSMESVLREIVRIQGMETLGSRQRTLSLFADLAPRLTRERRVLHSFLDCGGNQSMLRAKNSPEGEQRIQYEQTVFRMQDELSITESAARNVCTIFGMVVYGRPREWFQPEPRKEPEPPHQTLPPKPEPPKQDAEALFQKGMDWEAKKEYPLALSYYHKAARQGHEDAQMKCAHFHHFGIGTDQYYPLAATFYHDAAKQGNADAMYHLGTFFEYGHGRPQSTVAALSWYRKAAQKGHPDAQIKCNTLAAQSTGQNPAQPQKQGQLFRPK